MELYLQLHILVIQAFVQMTEAHSFVWCTWLYCDFNNISINCAAILPFYINTPGSCKANILHCIHRSATGTKWA